MTTTAARPEKYIARAYDAGLGNFKRYIVEATDEEDARRILTVSGLGDADIESYRAFHRRRRRRSRAIVGGILLLLAVGVGVLLWQPWRTPTRSNSSAAAHRDAKPAHPKAGATDAADMGPSFNDLSDRYDLDDGQLHLTPPPVGEAVKK